MAISIPQNKNLLEGLLLVGGLVLAVVIMSFSDDLRVVTGSTVTPSNEVNISGAKIRTSYIDGAFTKESFFAENAGRYALLYNHRPTRKIMEVSLQGELLSSFEVPFKKEKDDGVHIVEKAGNHIYAVIQVRGIYKGTLDGEKVWWKNFAAHHDLAHDSEGNIYSFDLKTRKRKIQGTEVTIFEDDLVKLDPDGKELWRKELFPILEPLITDEVAMETRRKWRIKLEKHDILHLNSLSLLPRDIEGLGNKGDFLISIRDLDTLVVLDKDDLSLKWSYGSGELQHQHHASITANDEILVFDNGVTRGKSRAVRIDPVIKQVVWQYGQPKNAKFFTRRHGSAQELPNGNVLIALGRKGRFYEVTPDEQVVASGKLMAPGIEEVNPFRFLVFERF